MSPHFLWLWLSFSPGAPSVSVGEFKGPAFGHFFLFPRLFIPTGRMAASHSSFWPTVVRLGRLGGLKACPVRADQSLLLCDNSRTEPSLKVSSQVLGWRRRAGEVFDLFS